MRLKPENYQVRYSTGTGRNFGRAKNKSLSWTEFKKLFAVPSITKEKQSRYDKMSHEEQVELKSIAGWFYRTQVDGGVRNRKSGKASDILTFDFDYATEEWLDQLEMGLVAPGLSYFVLSTRRHRRESPRLRLIVLLDSPVTNEMYPVVSRIVAQRFFDPDMKMVDKVSFRPAQMMFFPTISTGQEYIFLDNDASGITEPLDVVAVLDEFEREHGDWRNVQNLPRVDGEEIRLTADKAENPLEKRGPVGNFCRAYPNIEDAMAKFLPGVYEPSDDSSEKPRYTYVNSTTANGAVIEDDGLFLYSHHGSDPVAERLVNAFDLIRIHRFEHLDEKCDPETPMHKRPSWEAMIDLISDDPKYKQEQAAEKYDLEAMFDDLDVFDGDDFDPDADEEEEDLVGDINQPRGSSREAESDTDDEEDLVGDPRRANPPEPPKKRRPKWKPPEKGWHLQLQINTAGKFEGSVTNLATIIQKDARCGPCVEYNDFFTKIVTRVPLRSKMEIIPHMPISDPDNGDPWEDRHSNALRAMLEAENGPGKPGWGLKVTDRDLHAALELAARQYPFHPVKDKIEAVEWDGKERLETLFIDYLGCPDNVYTREAARKYFIAAIARIYEPGHKFDFVPILEGGQGIRKSTFIRTISMGWFGELKGDFADEKRMVEQMMGCFIMELPELSAVTRSSVEEIKAFCSAKESVVRLSYGRLSQIFKRQCVFMGSTNEHEYLIDHTGNRRWWPLQVKVRYIDIDKLKREIAQIWAEARAAYVAMRAAQPYDELPLYLENPEAVRIANELQEEARTQTETDIIAGRIQDWLDRPVEPEVFDEAPREPVFRTVTCAAQVWKEALGNQKDPNMAEARSLGRALRMVGWISLGRQTLHPYGNVKAFGRPEGDLDRLKTQYDAEFDIDGLV